MPERLPRGKPALSIDQMGQIAELSEKYLQCEAAEFSEDELLSNLRMLYELSLQQDSKISCRHAKKIEKLAITAFSAFGPNRHPHPTSDTAGGTGTGVRANKKWQKFKTMLHEGIIKSKLADQNKNEKQDLPKKDPEGVSRLLKREYREILKKEGLEAASAFAGAIEVIKGAPKNCEQVPRILYSMWKAYGGQVLKEYSLAVSDLFSGKPTIALNFMANEHAYVMRALSTELFECGRTRKEFLASLQEYNSKAEEPLDIRIGKIDFLKTKNKSFRRFDFGKHEVTFYNDKIVVARHEIEKMVGRAQGFRNPLFKNEYLKFSGASDAEALIRERFTFLYDKPRMLAGLSPLLQKIMASYAADPFLAYDMVYNALYTDADLHAAKAMASGFVADLIKKTQPVLLFSAPEGEFREAYRKKMESGGHHFGDYEFDKMNGVSSAHYDGGIIRKKDGMLSIYSYKAIFQVTHCLSEYAIGKGVADAMRLAVKLSDASTISSLNALAKADVPSDCVRAFVDLVAIDARLAAKFQAEIVNVGAGMGKEKRTELQKRVAYFISETNRGEYIDIYSHRNIRYGPKSSEEGQANENDGLGITPGTRAHTFNNAVELVKIFTLSKLTKEEAARLEGMDYGWIEKDNWFRISTSPRNDFTASNISSREGDLTQIVENLSNTTVRQALEIGFDKGKWNERDILEFARRRDKDACNKCCQAALYYSGQSKELTSAVIFGLGRTLNPGDTGANTINYAKALLNEQVRSFLASEFNKAGKNESGIRKLPDKIANLSHLGDGAPAEAVSVISQYKISLDAQLKMLEFLGSAGSEFHNMTKGLSEPAVVRLFEKIDFMGEKRDESLEYTLSVIYNASKETPPMSARYAAILSPYTENKAAYRNIVSVLVLKETPMPAAFYALSLKKARNALIETGGTISLGTTYLPIIRHGKEYAHAWANVLDTYRKSPQIMQVLSERAAYSLSPGEIMTLANAITRAEVVPVVVSLANKPGAVSAFSSLASKGEVSVIEWAKTAKMYENRPQLITEMTISDLRGSLSGDVAIALRLPNVYSAMATSKQPRDIIQLLDLSIERFFLYFNSHIIYENRIIYEDGKGGLQLTETEKESYLLHKEEQRLRLDNAFKSIQAAANLAGDKDGHIFASMYRIMALSHQVSNFPSSINEFTRLGIKLVHTYRKSGVYPEDSRLIDNICYNTIGTHIKGIRDFDLVGSALAELKETCSKNSLDEKKMLSEVVPMLAEGEGTVGFKNIGKNAIIASEVIRIYQEAKSVKETEFFFTSTNIGTALKSPADAAQLAKQGFHPVVFIALATLGEDWGPDGARALRKLIPPNGEINKEKYVRPVFVSFIQEKPELQAKLLKGLVELGLGDRDDQKLLQLMSFAHTLGDPFVEKVISNKHRTMDAALESARAIAVDLLSSKYPKNALESMDRNSLARWLSVYPEFEQTMYIQHDEKFIPALRVIATVELLGKEREFALHDPEFAKYLLENVRTLFPDASEHEGVGAYITKWSLMEPEKSVFGDKLDAGIVAQKLVGWRKPLKREHILEEISIIDRIENVAAKLDDVFVKNHFCDEFSRVAGLYDGAVTSEMLAEQWRMRKTEGAGEEELRQIANQQIQHRKWQKLQSLYNNYEERFSKLQEKIAAAASNLSPYSDIITGWGFDYGDSFGNKVFRGELSALSIRCATESATSKEDMRLQELSGKIAELEKTCSDAESYLLTLSELLSPSDRKKGGILTHLHEKKEWAQMVAEKLEKNELGREGALEEIRSSQPQLYSTVDGIEGMDENSLKDLLRRYTDLTAITDLETIVAISRNEDSQKSQALAYVNQPVFSKMELAMVGQCLDFRYSKNSIANAPYTVSYIDSLRQLVVAYPASDTELEHPKVNGLIYLATMDDGGEKTPAIIMDTIFTSDKTGLGWSKIEGHVLFALQRAGDMSLPLVAPNFLSTYYDNIREWADISGFSVKAAKVNVQVLPGPAGATYSEVGMDGFPQYEAGREISIDALILKKT